MVRVEKLSKKKVRKLYMKMKKHEIVKMLMECQYIIESDGYI